MSLSTIFNVAVHRYGHRGAIRDNGAETTYRELKKKVTTLRGELKRIGVRAGDHVGLFMANGVDFVAAYFAIQQLKAVGVLIPAALRSWDLAEMLLRCDIKYIVYDSPRAAFLDASTMLPRQGMLGNIGFGVYRTPADRPKSQGTAIIIATSGTSGRTKGVMLSADAVAANAEAYAKDMRLTPEARCIVTLPLTSGFAHTTQMLAHLMTGGLLIISRSPFISRLFCKAIEQEKPTITGLVPSQLKEILSLGRDWPRDLFPHIVLAGAPISDDLIQRAKKLLPGTPIIKAYGLTEAGPRVTHLHCKDKAWTSACVGTPLVGIRVRITNEWNEPLAAGEQGNVLIQSPSLMLGYYRDPELSNAALVDGWLITGDIGYMDRGGNLFIVGRKRNVINKAGTKISAEELEEFLESLPHVKEALVFSLPDPKCGEKIVADIVPAKPGAIDLSQLIMHCRKQLAAYKVPDEVRIIKDLPRNPQGKLLRHADLLSQ